MCCFSLKSVGSKALNPRPVLDTVSVSTVEKIACDCGLDRIIVSPVYRQQYSGVSAQEKRQVKASNVTT